MPATVVPAQFTFQTTDPTTNAVTGTANAAVTIPAGKSQSFVVAFTWTSAFVPTDVALAYSCTNSDTVPTIVGVNSLLLTASDTPVPDMIAVGLTLSNDGFARTGGPSGTGIFAVASANIGATGTLTARARLSDPSLPLIPTVCQTDPNSGQCFATPAPTATATINQNQNTTWSVFLQATGTAVAADPAANRIFFEFVDANGIVRGSTSTAATTQ